MNCSASKSCNPSSGATRSLLCSNSGRPPRAFTASDTGLIFDWMGSRVNIDGVQGRDGLSPFFWKPVPSRLFGLASALKRGDFKTIVAERKNFDQKGVPLV